MRDHPVFARLGRDFPGPPRPGASLYASRSCTEYVQLMSGGGVHVRSSSPELEAVYPLELWIPDHLRHGGRVVRRRVVVVEDWVEVTEP